MTSYGALAGAADHRVGLFIGQPHAAAGIAFHQPQQLHHQVQPDVALRDHEPRQHALGVLFALPFRLRADQRHDPQFVVASVRTAHQPPAPGMDARLMPPPTQQARPPSRGFGHRRHRRQICLNVEVCEFRMCQFSGGGHRVPGKVLAVAPISFSSLRNRFPANLSYAPWRGCTKPGTLTWRATVCGNRVGESVRSSRIERGGADLRILGVPIYTPSCPVTWSHGKRHGNGSKDARDHHANGRRSQYARR